MKLGKQPVRLDPRTLQFARYLDQALPAFPDAQDWAGKVPGPWGMMLNDQIGDCTCASAGHLIMSWTADNAAPVTPADADIQAAYSAITGYDPVTGANDNGAVELNVLNFWRNTGIAGHKIGAYASIDPTNLDHVKAAIFLFGGIYTGFELPITCQGQARWEITGVGTTGPGAPGSWGGHAVPAMSYDDAGVTIITWGQPVKVAWDFFVTYCDEAYAIISPDFITGSLPAPNGFSMDQLVQDLQAIK